MEHYLSELAAGGYPSEFATIQQHCSTLHDVFAQRAAFGSRLSSFTYRFRVHCSDDELASLRNETTGAGTSLSLLEEMLSFLLVLESAERSILQGLREVVEGDVVFRLENGDAGEGELFSLQSH